jgi:hypothetical protein
MTQRDSGFYIQLGCGFFVLAAIFLCGFLATFGKIQADHFWDGGTHVEGVVVGIEPEIVTSSNSIGTDIRKRIASENVQFEYLVDGQPFYHRQRFHYDTPFYVGQTLPVVYLPNTPWTAEIVLDADVDPYTVFAIGIGGVLMIGVLMILFGSNSRKKQKRKPHQEFLSL